MMAKAQWVEKRKWKRRMFRMEDDHERNRRFVFNEARIFDFGCGDCEFFDTLKGFKGLRLVGHDIDKRELKKAKAKMYEVYDNLKKVKGKFDLVIVNEVIEHLYRKEITEFFEKTKEILDSNGKIIISTRNPNEFYNMRFWENWQHTRPFTITAMREMANHFGFRIIKVIRHHYRTNPLKILVNLIFGLDHFTGYTVVMKRSV